MLTSIKCHYGSYDVFARDLRWRCLRRTCVPLFVTPFAHQAARMSELSGPPTSAPSLATSISPAGTTPKVSSSVRWNAIGRARRIVTIMRCSCMTREEKEERKTERRRSRRTARRKSGNRRRFAFGYAGYIRRLYILQSCHLSEATQTCVCHYQR